MTQKLPWKSFTKKRLFIGIITLLFLVALFPVRVPCGGVPYYTCTTAPDPDGTYTTSFDIEPLFLMVVEKKTMRDYPFKYFSGAVKKHIKKRHTKTTPIPVQIHDKRTEKADIPINWWGSFFGDNLRIAYSRYITNSGGTSWKKTSPKLIVMIEGDPELTQILQLKPLLKTQVGKYAVTVTKATRYKVTIEVSIVPASQEKNASQKTVNKTRLGGYCEEYGNYYAGELAHFFDDHLRIGLSKMTGKNGEPSLQLWIGIKDNPDLTKTLEVKAPKRIKIGIFQIDVISVNSAGANFRVIRTDTNCLHSQKKEF